MSRVRSERRIEYAGSVHDEREIEAVVEVLDLEYDNLFIFDENGWNFDSPCCAMRPTGWPDGGLPNADRVMEWGLILPNNHSLSDDDCDYMGETLEGFVIERGLR